MHCGRGTSGRGLAEDRGSFVVRGLWFSRPEAEGRTRQLRGGRETARVRPAGSCTAREDKYVRSGATHGASRGSVESGKRTGTGTTSASTPQPDSVPFRAGSNRISFTRKRSPPDRGRPRSPRTRLAPAHPHPHPRPHEHTYEHEREQVHRRLAHTQAHPTPAPSPRPECRRCRDRAPPPRAVADPPPPAPRPQPW